MWWLPACRRVRECEAEGNKLGQALCRGHVLANHAAAATIDEAITEVFDLWSQLDP